MERDLIDMYAHKAAPDELLIDALETIRFRQELLLNILKLA